MTSRTPAPDPGPDAGRTARRVATLPALPGSDSDAAVRTAAGAGARRGPGGGNGHVPGRSRPGADRPGTDGATALAPSAEPEHETALPVVEPVDPEIAAAADLGTAGAPALDEPLDEEALVEAGIAELWDAYAAAPRKSTKDRLVLHYAPLVKYVAGRVGTGLPSHVDVADLIQCGIFGLVDAIERFEPDRGRKFEVYAMQRIRGAILDELRSQDWVPRSVRSRAREIERAIERLESREQRSCSDAELAGELGMGTEDLRSTFGQIAMTSVAALDELVAAGRGGDGAGTGAPSLADSLPDAGAEDPLAAMETRETRRLLAEAVGQLAERDRTVVGLYYFENLTLAEIGRVLGVTESRVCQLHTRAVMRLRARLAEVSHG